MPQWINDNGIWKQHHSTWVNEGGTWKEIKQTPVPLVGELFEGGYVYGYQLLDGADTGEIDILVAAPWSSGKTGAQWSSRSSYNSDADFIFDGQDNIPGISHGNNYDPDAHLWCAGRTTGGYTDWYLPSIYEIEMLLYVSPALPAAGNMRDRMIALGLTDAWSSTEKNSSSAWTARIGSATGSVTLDGWSSRAKGNTDVWTHPVRRVQVR